MNNTEFKEDFFVNTDGIKLYRQKYQPISQRISAVVFLSHGLFEHCQSKYYDTIIKPLQQINCFVLTHDHYGHGRSEGNRGVITSIDLLVRDVICDIEETINELALPETIPKFLYGHSMGGLIAVHASVIKTAFFTGMVLEAPALAHNVNQITVSIGYCINYLFPSCPTIKLNTSNMSRDVEYVESIKDDPLHIQSRLSATTGIAIANGINRCKELYKNISMPVLIGHGDCDLLAPCSGSKLFMANIASTDKTLITYPNAMHQLRMEIDNVNVDFIQKVVEWIKERIV